MAAATRAGIDPARAVEIIQASTGRSNATETKFPRFILNGAFDAGFSIRLMVKDLDGYTRLARETGARVAAAGNVHYHLRERHQLQDCLVAIRQCKSLEETHRERRPNAHFYPKSPAEMAALARRNGRPDWEYLLRTGYMPKPASTPSPSGAAR